MGNCKIYKMEESYPSSNVRLNRIGLWMKSHQNKSLSIDIGSLHHLILFFKKSISMCININIGIQSSRI